MPHAEASTRDPQGRRTCPYCGYPLRTDAATCPGHRDLPALEPLDGRFTMKGTDDRPLPNGF